MVRDWSLVSVLEVDSRYLKVESPKTASELTQRSQRAQSSRRRNGRPYTRVSLERVRIPLKGNEL